MTKHWAYHVAKTIKKFFNPLNYYRLLRHIIFWRIRRPSNYLFDKITTILFYKETHAIQYQSTATPRKKNLCIFSHYDPDGSIDPYVEYYLRELARCDCDIIFVTAPNTQPSALEHIKTYCKKIIAKSNQGRDFAAYRLAIQTESNLFHYEKVILANDSVYGPLFNIQKVIDFGDKHQLDLWSVTDSNEITYHLQSYFLVFSKSLVQHHLFMKFWKKIYSLKNRLNIVQYYELGLSTYFLKKGFKIKAYCDYTLLNDKIVFFKKCAINPTLYLWKTMITDYQCPFLKREIFTNTSLKIYLGDWAAVLKQYTNFDSTLIANHLHRIAKNNPLLSST